MIWLLMKRDRAWLMMPFLAALAAIYSEADALQAHWPPLGGLAIYALFAYVVLAIACLIGSRMNLRATPFLAGLPIHGRVLWLARILAMGALIWIPAVILTIGRAGAGLPESIGSLKFAAGQSLLVALCQLLRPRQLTAIVWPVFVLLFFGCGLFLHFPMSVLVWKLPQVISGSVEPGVPEFVTYFSGAALLASATLLFGVGCAIPASFETVPSFGQASRLRKYLRSLWAAFKGWAWWKRLRDLFGADWGQTATLAWFAFRSVAPGTLFLLPFLPWTLSPHPGVIDVVMTCNLVSLSGMTGSTWSWLDTLPVDRRRIYLWTVVCGALLPVLGAYLLTIRIDYQGDEFGVSSRTLSRTILTEEQLWPPKTSFEDAKDKGFRVRNVMPPLEYWLPAMSGEAPVIQSPWGERFQPPVSVTMGAVMYNPFAVGSSNSKRFFDWQYARASQSVYGREIPPSERLPLKVPSLRTQILNLALRACWLLILGASAPMGRWRRHRRWKAVLGALSLSTIFIPILGLYYLEHEVTFGPAIDMIIQRIVWALPEHPLYWVVAALGPIAFASLVFLAGVRYAEFEYTAPFNFDNWLKGRPQKVDFPKLY